MKSIEQATRLLRDGKLVAIPTETVYGLGADAKNPVAVQKIYTAKGRPSSNPLIIHLPQGDAIIDWAIEIPDAATRLAKAFWPGPLTLILKRHPSVPTIVTGGQDSVALRVPNHPLTLALLHHFQGGIAAPSANRYGRISPTTAQHVEEELGASVDFILDGGPCTVGIESTIVSLLDKTPVVLREGSISTAALSKVLRKTVAIKPTQMNIQVPGSSASHYAPEKPLFLTETKDLINTLHHLGERKKRGDVLSFSEKLQEPQVTDFISNWVHVPLDPIFYAHQLYAQLRAFDKTSSDCIVVEMPSENEAWIAVRDRLQRAASPLE